MRFDQGLPTTVEIDGEEYPIRSDFRTSIQFEMLVQEETKEEQLLLQMLDLYYEEIPPNVTAAVEKALWFYSGGRKEEKSSSGSGSNTQPYSFECDWDYIYAAFLEQFQVDLEETDLHWWKFRAMFASLSDKTKFAEIIGYRTVKVDSKMPKQQKDFYNRMKKIYALPKNNLEQQRVQDLRERLKNGENIIEDLL